MWLSRNTAEIGYIIHKEEVTLVARKFLTWNITCDALRDLILFVQFKKCEKFSWRSVTFSKAVAFIFPLVPRLLIQKANTCSKSTIEIVQKQLLNMFEANNKDTGKTLTSFCYLYC